MPRTFVTADLHFGHKGVCLFNKADGTPLRPWNTPDEMDDGLIDLWNSTVNPSDLVYVLGDFCLSKKALHKAGRLNGRKVLIAGNHDIFKLKDYTPYFTDIKACHVVKGAILTHIPIHPASLARYGCNIHGHLHSNVVMTKEGRWFKKSISDPRYICVSVEQTNFKPVSMDKLLDRARSL